MPVPGLEKNIGALVEKSAARFEEKKAIHFDHENSSFSFKALNERVNQFANAFQGEGIRRGDHVAVMLPNCPEFPLTWLALAKIGAVMVPVNVRYRSVDLAYVLDDSDASGLVIQDEFASAFREARSEAPKVRKVFLVGERQDDLGKSLKDLADESPPEFTSAELALDDLMNIQYTSGTTGFPKGCLLTHEYWLTLGLSTSRLINSNDIYLCVEPFYYMDPQWVLIMCLITGCAMVMTRKFSPSKYMKLVHQYRATASWALMAPWILKQPRSPHDRDHNLRFVFVGGFPPDLHHKFEERFRVTAREAYGMTEIGTGMYVPLEDAHLTGSGSVGKPPEFREVRIVDQDDKDVAPGEIGELLVKGPGLFKGYYKKPQETSDAFLGEWFRTGDLFRRDENGCYYIVGRKKDMIRRSGDNISATEVENVLVSHPKILSAAVVAVPDAERREEVKAYIVPAPGETPETIPPAEIMAYCLDRLAEFKTPRYLEYRTEFPRTPTGKIQKNTLLAEKKDLIAGCYDRFAH
ncbi:MAG: class I adenylate-forming enzyme family protein [Thermodesulfobacteriota bacterium]